MRLPPEWKTFIEPYLNTCEFEQELKYFIEKQPFCLPQPEMIFHALQRVEPARVRCVLYGEDPYPRIASANGVAFWDAEIKTWDDKTNGNSLKNILKALLVARGLADYHTSIAQCRLIARQRKLPQPPQLFEQWLEEGILLINTAMTFAGSGNKREHFQFWQPFHLALIRALNQRSQSPVYVLWGRKAQQWKTAIEAGIDDKQKIICQGHPTFIHQFLDKTRPHWSPFNAIEQKSGLSWI